jgi:hypothetical protein
MVDERSYHESMDKQVIGEDVVPTGSSGAREDREVSSAPAPQDTHVYSPGTNLPSGIPKNLNPPGINSPPRNNTS